MLNIYVYMHSPSNGQNDGKKGLLHPQCKINAACMYTHMALMFFNRPVHHMAVLCRHNDFSSV